MLLRPNPTLDRQVPPCDHCRRATAAEKWNRIAVGAFFGLIVCALFIFLPTTTGAFDWRTFADRAFVSLTFGVFAGYAAQQARHHQRLELQTRQMELEMASVRPFLAPLEERERNAMISKLADRTFAQPPVSETSAMAAPRPACSSKR